MSSINTMPSETGNQRTVFISHDSREAAVARVLHKHLEMAFASAIDIFNSSDGKSITGGKLWFDHIVKSVPVQLEMEKAFSQ